MERAAEGQLGFQPTWAAPLAKAGRDPEMSEPGVCSAHYSLPLPVVDIANRSPIAYSHLPNWDLPAPGTYMAGREPSWNGPWTCFPLLPPLPPGLGK